MSGELNETVFCYHSGSAATPGAGHGGSTEGATGGSGTQPAGGVLGVDECASVSPVCSVCSICATFVRRLLADTGRPTQMDTERTQLLRNMSSCVRFEVIFCLSES